MLYVQIFHGYELPSDRVVIKCFGRSWPQTFGYDPTTPHFFLLSNTLYSYRIFYNLSSLIFSLLLNGFTRVVIQITHIWHRWKMKFFLQVMLFLSFSYSFPSEQHTGILYHWNKWFIEWWTSIGKLRKRMF